MGLTDITLRISSLESLTNKLDRWQETYGSKINTISSYNDRISALEGNISNKFEDNLIQYAALFNGEDRTKEKGHGFIFFTDPHNLNGIDDYKVMLQFDTISTIYYNTPAAYVLCGGDWINTGLSAAEAKYRVGRVPNLLKQYFGGNAYTVIGNHDLNQQSPIDRRLTIAELSRMWFNKDVGYYYIDYDNTRCYMFDSSYMLNYDMSILDPSKNDPNYRWNQIDWFANSLLTCDKKHIFGLIHITNRRSNDEEVMTESELPGVPQFYYNVTKVINAYNKRQSLTLNNITYNFSSCQNTYHFTLAGHTHVNEEKITNGIPTYITGNTLDSNSNAACIDCCYADWDNNILYMRQTGLTTIELNRTLPIIPMGEYEIQQSNT